MPLLAAWLSSLLAAFAGRFAAWLTTRSAMIAAGIATFGVMVAAIYAALGALVAGLYVAFPNTGMIATGIWLFVPSNAPVCIAATIAADVALSLFFWQFVHLKIALRGAS